MSAITLSYRDLSFEAMVKISELADILKVTPSRAREIYLSESAKRQIANSNVKEVVS